MANRSRRGFALLITITLLAFLVLLMVSLASLTRVETQVASNTQYQEKARQHALMALNLAMGELQRTAGPDKRITATADILAASDATKAKWTGVWDATSTTAAPEWLVSGTTAQRVNTGAMAAADGTNQILLVGAGSTDTTVPSNQVVVPAQALLANVVGLGNNQEVGRFAWWVGDEGVKARVNLTDPLAPRAASTDGSAPAFTPTPAQEQLRLSAAQRLGVERETGLDEIATSLAQTPAAADARLAVAKLINGRQLSLINSGITSAEALARFHDITAYSAGVLSDTRKGGLRGDLTNLFAPTSVSSFQSRLTTHLGTNRTWTVNGSAGPFNPIVSDINDDGTSAAGDTWDQGPTWEQLWSFSHQDNAPSATPAGVVNSGQVQPRGQTPTQHGIAPVLVQARLYNGITISPAASPAGSYQVDLSIFPAFVLANPYAATLAPATYYVTIDTGSTASLDGGTTRLGWFLTGEANFHAFRPFTYLYDKVRFQLNSPAIGPGEALIFTLKWGQAGWNSSTYSYPHSTTGTYVMENDWDNGVASITPTLFTPTSTIITNADLTTKGVRTRVGDFSASGGDIALRFNLWVDNNGSMELVQRVEPGFKGPSSTMATVTTQVTRQIQGGFIVTRLGPGDGPGDNLVNAVNTRALDAAARFGNGGSSAAPGIGYQLLFGTNPTTTSPFGCRMVIDADSKHVYWGKRSQGGGTALNAIIPGESLLKAELFDVPNLNAPLVSIGQLQHFNATGHLDGYTHTLGSIPAKETTAKMQGAPLTTGYAIGHSRASAFIKRDQTTNGNIYDASYLLNRELFDSYFFSALPQTGAFDFATDKAANARLRPFRSEVASNAIASYTSSPRAAAVNLLNIGAFNINSTSLEAWKALFSSLNQIPYPGTTTMLTGAFARSVHQTGGNTDVTDGVVGTNSWIGYRNLSTAEIDSLATQMVAAVKTRGPFRSLSDFVNRRLATDATGLQGALEDAITAAGINKVTATPYKDLPSRTNNPVVDSTNREIQVAGASGWFGQGDLLQALAPGLSARSDTFIIRTYGDVRNPVTGGTQPDARAWLEAVVQRLPDYIVPKSGTTGNAPEETPTSGSDNEKYGRRFRVISFRWLNSTEI